MSQRGYGYRVCDRLLDPETNAHCEFDGIVLIREASYWYCPACGVKWWEA